MKKIWFKNKRYGWGWTPVTWEGWLVLFVYVAAVIGSLIYFSNNPINSDFEYRAPLTFFAFTVILILISYTRGEQPGWHWGDDEKE